MKRHEPRHKKNLFRLGETEDWYISVQPDKNHAHSPSLRMVVHDKRTQHKLAFVLLTTTRRSSSGSTTSALMGLYIDPKHRAQGLTRRILSLWLQWCMYVDPNMHPTTEIIRKPLLCCVLEHSLGFAVSAASVSSCLAVQLVVLRAMNATSTGTSGRIQLHSIPPQCLRGTFSVRDIQREGLQVHCSCRTCRANPPEQKEKEEPLDDLQPQPQLQQQHEERRRRIHLNARFERAEAWKTLPEDPILKTTLRPDQLRLILLGHL